MAWQHRSERMMSFDARTGGAMTWSSTALALLLALATLITACGGDESEPAPATCIDSGGGDTDLEEDTPQVTDTEPDLGDDDVSADVDPPDPDTGDGVDAGEVSQPPATCDLSVGPRRATRCPRRGWGSNAGTGAPRGRRWCGLSVPCGAHPLVGVKRASRRRQARLRAPSAPDRAAQPGTSS